MLAVTHPGSLTLARPAPEPSAATAVARRELPLVLARLVEQQSAAEAIDRFGYRSRGGRTPALAITLSIHAALIALLLSTQVAPIRTVKPHALTTFDVSPPAPPPEPFEPVEPTAAAAPPPIVAPPPLVKTPLPAPQVQTVAEPPAIAMPAAVAEAAPAKTTAAPAPAPPAPITPPDFRAAQLNNPGPAYPFQSRKAREQGVVMLRVLVTEGGRAGEVRLQDSSGSSRLDQAAITTVKRWRFLPARQAGTPVQAWVLVPVTFKLG